MSTGTENTSETDTFQGTFQFTYKPLWSHLWDFVKRPIPTFLAAASVFCVLWTLAETPLSFARIGAHDWLSYRALLGVSLLLSVVWNGYLYWQQVPDGFEGVSRRTALLAHRRRPKWQFRLAKGLLAERLGPLVRELKEVQTGRAFVRLEKPPTLDAYKDWALIRIESLTRMISVAKQLLIQDFPRALQSTPTKAADPKEILATVDSLARFYRETVEFEREARGILTSQGLQALHQHQLGWSDPVREAVHDLFRFLQKICDCNPRERPRIEYTITFGSPPGVEEFGDEIARLGPRYSQLARDW